MIYYLLGVLHRAAWFVKRVVYAYAIKKDASYMRVIKKLFSYLCVMTSNFIYLRTILDGWRLNRDVMSCVKTVLYLCIIIG